MRGSLGKGGQKQEQVTCGAECGVIVGLKEGAGMVKGGAGREGLVKGGAGRERRRLGRVDRIRSLVLSVA